MSAQPHDLAVAQPAERPRLRILPIPDPEPPPLPRDVPVPVPDPRYVQEFLAVDFRRQGDDGFFGPQATGRGALPDPTPWARRLVTALLEAMDGLRPAGQLSRWVSVDIRERIARRGVLARRDHLRPSGAVRVLTSRTCEPTDGVAEVAVVVCHRSRPRAVALRLAGVDGRWVLTALELG